MKTLVWIVVLASLGAGAWRLLGAGGAVQGEQLPEGSLHTVTRADLRISVNESGYLKAKNNEKIKPRFRRQAAITWLVEEGLEVAEGDKLVEFDPSELQTQVDDLESALITAQAELESARADLEIQKRDSAASIESATFLLEVSQLKRQRYDEGEGPNELRKRELSAEKAASEFTRAQERFEQVPQLAQEGFLTKNEVEEERIGLREAEINAENAAKDLDLYRTYTDRMERKQLEADVRDAERLLLNAREKSVIQQQECEARVSSAESKVRTTEARLRKLQEELSFMTIVAPRAGTVHLGDPEAPWRREEIKVGNTTNQGTVLVTLPDLSEMQVLLQIHEAEIDLVKLDQEALVTVEAVKGKVLKGKVTEIASVANSNWMDEANKTFRVEVTLDAGELSLRAGISAKVEILVEVLEDVLQVPIHAVVVEDGRHFCFAAVGNSYEMRAVKIGRNNTHSVEVQEGLAQGERVLLYDPRVAGIGGEAQGPGSKATGPDEDVGLSPSAAGGQTE